MQNRIPYDKEHEKNKVINFVDDNDILGKTFKRYLKNLASPLMNLHVKRILSFIFLVSYLFSLPEPH